LIAWSRGLAVDGVSVAVHASRVSAPTHSNGNVAGEMVKGVCLCHSES
jgi:hypothetical protein